MKKSNFLKTGYKLNNKIIYAKIIDTEYGERYMFFIDISYGNECLFEPVPKSKIKMFEGKLNLPSNIIELKNW